MTFTSADRGTPGLVVLDTNVVLDWLVFADRSCVDLADAVTTGRAHWVASAAMRRELEHVIARPELARWRPDPRAVAAAWQRWARPVEAVAPRAMPPLRCTDPDDQMFIDLALQVGASSLLSRDRAVLRLARRARAFGLTIAPASAWRP